MVAGKAGLAREGHSPTARLRREMSDEEPAGAATLPKVLMFRKPIVFRCVR
jgi:hypothetical protein